MTGLVSERKDQSRIERLGSADTVGEACDDFAALFHRDLLRAIVGGFARDRQLDRAGIVLVVALLKCPVSRGGLTLDLIGSCICRVRVLLRMTGTRCERDGQPQSRALRQGSLKVQRPVSLFGSNEARTG